MNTKLFKSEFNDILNAEIELRERFKTKRQELEDMVQEITNHIGNCNQFWNKHISEDVEKFVVTLKDGKAFEIKRPDKEKCYVESYLPFGVDYTNASVFNCT